ncbi:MAG: hypothetical protein J6K78_07160 [Tidjanibacter sp.]|nr:hypothetical protein [Tidjanibacter sp.]
MKKSLFFLSAALVLVSCATDVNDNIKPELPEGELTFVAGIDNEDATRVGLTSGVSAWEAADQIGVFSVDAENAILSANISYATEDAGAKATFAPAGEDVVVAGTKYYAMYPYCKGYPSKLNASGDFGAVAAGDPITDYKYAPWVSNATQIFTPTDGGLTTSNNDYYLYGSGVAPVEGNKVQMTFTHALPILEIGLLGMDRVTKVQLQTVTKADGNVQAENKFLNAKGIVNLATGEIITTNIASTGHRVIGSIEGGATLNTTTPLRLKFIVGRFECKDGMTVTVTLADGSTINKTIWEGKTVSMYDAAKGKNKHVYQPIIVPYVTAEAPAEFAAAGGTATIIPATSSAWTITSKPEWATVSVSEGATGEGFVVTVEASTAAARTGVIEFTNAEGAKGSVTISQAEYVAVAANYYSVVVNDIDWTASYVQHVKNAGGDIIATITKEYLGATEDKQVVVVYNGTNLASGLTLDGATIAIPDMNPANVVYDGGEGTDAAVVYIKDDGSEISFTEQAGASTATIAPYVLTSDVKDHATVKIGSKIWLAEDFCTTKYADGTAIGTEDTLTEGRRYLYNGNYLYNAFALGHGAEGSTDFTDKISPDGWALFTEADWSDLTTFVGGTYDNYWKDGANLSLYSGVTSGKYTYSSSKNKWTAAAVAYPSTLGQNVSSDGKKIGFFGINTTKFVNTTQPKTSCFPVRLVQE